MKLAILQAHQPDYLKPWIARCVDTVEVWAKAMHGDYYTESHEFFERVSPVLRDKFPDRSVVVTDLARLYWCQEVLEQGYDRVVWLDADLLMLRPDDFKPEPGPDGYAFGYETWVQWDSEKQSYKAKPRLHNAYLVFDQGNPFLDFYIHAAEKLLQQVTPPVVPQFIGPKFLAAMHNIITCPIDHRQAMLGPAVLRDILAGQGPALECFRQMTKAPICGVNLSASYVGKGEDGVCLDDAQMLQAVEALLENPSLLG